jgi:hypothetical protein
MKRAPMLCDNVAKLSFGAAAFKDINEIIVEKISVSVSSVRQPCLICVSFKDMKKYTSVRNPMNAHNEEKFFICSDSLWKHGKLRLG